MNAKLLLSACLVATAVPAYAENPPSNFNMVTTGKAADTATQPILWDTSIAHWDRVLSERRSAPELQIGKSDFIVSGPLIQGLRRQRTSSDLSLGQKFLRLPVVSWFVPQRMPSTPGGTGRYFAWGESSRPWVAVASGIPAGSAFTPAYNEPQGSLISLHWGSK